MDCPQIPSERSLCSPRPQTSLGVLKAAPYAGKVFLYLLIPQASSVLFQILLQDGALSETAPCLQKLTSKFEKSISLIKCVRIVIVFPIFPLLGGYRSYTLFVTNVVNKTKLIVSTTFKKKSRENSGLSIRSLSFVFWGALLYHFGTPL